MRTLLVTVGTTSFDELIRKLDSVAFVEKVGHGDEKFDEVLFQIGRGDYEPLYLQGLMENRRLPFEFKWFRFVPDLSVLIEKSSAVVSHCGAGTILEVLDRCMACDLVVAVNETLMGNHQTELAEALYARDLCQVVYPANFLNFTFSIEQRRGIRGIEREVMPDLFPQAIDEAMGFS